MTAAGLFIKPSHNIKGITQPGVLCDLFRVFNPSFKYMETEKLSQKTRNSTFKKCETDNREYFLYDVKKRQLVTKETVLSNTGTRTCLQYGCDKSNVFGKGIFDTYLFPLW